MLQSGNIFSLFDFYLLPLKFKIMFMAIGWKMRTFYLCIHCKCMPIKCNEFQILMQFKAKTIKRQVK